MSDLPHNYFIWHPRLSDDGAIVLNLTPGEQFSSPTKSQSFLQELSQHLVGGCQPKEMHLLEYRSSYQADLDSLEWEDRWPINWRIRITTLPKIKELPKLRREYTGNMAFDPLGMDRVRPTKTTCMIISDFECAQDADYCRGLIRSSKRLRDAQYLLGIKAPVAERVVIGNIAVQDQFDIGEFPDDFYRDGAEYAVAVESMCHVCGVFTNFEERTIARDEYYDPDGFE